jgi:hypothetical protein
MNHPTPLTSADPGRKPVAGRAVDAPPSEDVANWLQEVAKRPHVGTPPPISAAPQVQLRSAERRDLRTRLRVQHVWRLTAFAAIAGGFMLNYYMDVMLQIVNLRAVVVFV